MIFVGVFGSRIVGMISGRLSYPSVHLTLLKGTVMAQWALPLNKNHGLSH
jgi:hypothetical protein